MCPTGCKEQALSLSENKMFHACSRCKALKEGTEFNKNKTRKNGLQHYCRNCHGESVKTYLDNNRQSFNKKQAEQRERKRRKLYEYLCLHPCVDCGEDDVTVLDFDHLRDKKHTISSLIVSKRCWLYVLKEIEKCEVRCANCHRKKTAEAFGWKKFRWQSCSALATED